MNAEPDPQDRTARAPDRAGGGPSITMRDNAGIVSTGANAVNINIPLTGRSSFEEKLTDKASQLANQINGRLKEEVAQQRILAPQPLPLRWQPLSGRAPGQLDGDIIAPTEATNAALRYLARQLDEIVAGHRQGEAGWLLVLGREGSGKTILAMLFARDRLEARTDLDRAPVPVIFSLGSWNPDHTPLQGWLISQLERDQPYLAEAGDNGSTWAAALVAADYVLPILDGFDEIAGGLREAALKALSATTMPLLVTSRPAELKAAQGKVGINPSATGIELADLTLDATIRYLEATTSSGGTGTAEQAGWQYVLNELRRHPDKPASARLAAVLTTPLMVTLARFIYESDRDPADLVKPEEFGSQSALEKHLLDNFVPTAYARLPRNRPTEEPRRWDPERAQHWLGYLAAHLTELDTHDIEWWRLGTTMKLRSLMLLVGVTVGIASGLVAGLVYGSEGGLLGGLANGLMTASVAGPVNGLAVGLTFGLMHGFVTNLKVGGPMFEPSLMEIRLQGWAKNETKRRLRESFRPRVRGGLAGGLLFGLLWALGGAAYLALLGCPGPVIVLISVEQLAAGIGLGFAIGLIAALGAGFETVIPREKLALPSALLNTNRTTVLTQLLTIGLVIGSGYGIMFGLVNGALPGLAAGLVAGSMIALGAGTMTAWGRWVVLARIWLALTGRLPRDLNAFLYDAYERGVLRRVGAVYQFRHARLRDHLCEIHRERHRRHPRRAPKGFTAADLG